MMSCRHVRGEDLQGLNLEELQKLEKSIETSLCRVAEEKVMDLSAAGQRPLLEPDKSSYSYIRSMSSDDPRQEYNSPCAFLTLGLACHSHFHACILVLTEIILIYRESLSSSSF